VNPSRAPVRELREPLPRLTTLGFARTVRRVSVALHIPANSGRPLRIAALLLFGMSCAATPPDAQPAWLNAEVQGLPQCPYGIGYEKPWRVELLYAGELVDVDFHSGIFLGPKSLTVPLHVPSAMPGRYTIRIGQCPSLQTNMAAAAACATPELLIEFERELVPAGMENPVPIVLPILNVACLPDAVR
jgi:hypothetical protein